MNHITKLERETGIIWNEAENTAVLWTLSEPIKRKMTRTFGPPTSTHGTCQEWTIPKSCAKLPRKPRRLSDQARKAASDRLKAARSNKT